MKSDHDRERESERKPYRKPELRRVALKPEESLVAGCKTLSGGGPAGTCELGTSCWTTGS